VGWHSCAEGKMILGLALSFFFSIFIYLFMEGDGQEGK